MVQAVPECPMLTEAYVHQDAISPWCSMHISLAALQPLAFCHSHSAMSTTMAELHTSKRTFPCHFLTVSREQNQNKRNAWTQLHLGMGFPKVHAMPCAHRDENSLDLNRTLFAHSISKPCAQTNPSTHTRFFPGSFRRADLSAIFFIPFSSFEMSK